MNTTTAPAFNEYSWNTRANLLYIDQPPGTGFSNAHNTNDYFTNEDQVAGALWDFMVQFYTKNPQYSGLELYITGSSYAGHYIPSLTWHILRVNSIYSKNLKGIAIGNGWVDPILQYRSYIDYTREKDLITNATVAQATKDYATCKNLLDKKSYLPAFLMCQNLQTSILDAAQNHTGRNINPFDVRISCQYPNQALCYNFTALEGLLNQPDVRADLGVGSQPWSQCRNSVAGYFIKDSSLNFQDTVARVLDQGVRVLVYSGVEDYMCNYVGSRAWTVSTNWTSQEHFRDATFRDWMVGGVRAGRVKAYGGLTYLSVYEAGHLMPRDQPVHALDMVTRFIQNKPFA